MRFRMGGTLLAVLIFTRAAAATVADDVCAPADDPCVVDGPISVTAGSTLNFGVRGLEVRRGGVLDGGSGGLAIAAGSLRILPGGALLARGGAGPRAITITTTGAVSVEGTGSARGRIDASASTGSEIRITAGGDFTLGGDLRASQIGSSGRAGTVVVEALVATLTPTSRIVATGLPSDVGVQLTATGPMLLGGTIDVSGVDGGGAITIAGGRIELTGELDARGRDDGDGGTVDIGSTANVFLRGPIVASSGCDIDDGCGSTGGDVTIDTTTGSGSVLIAAPITLTGEGLDGTGGTLTIDTIDVVQTATVLVNGRGEEGSGGEVTITAQGNVTLGGIDAGGRGGDGGSVDVDARGRLTAAGEIDADGENGAGTIDLAGENIVIAASVHASSTAALGGTIDAVACATLEVVAGADVATRGDLGRNELSAARGMTIAGSLLAGTGATGAGGTNALVFRLIAPTITPEAVIVPAPTQAANLGLELCPAPPTPGCGNGVLDEGEACDDGNLDPCDGCSATCALEGCGNDVEETGCGEECDDGNADACDGCSPVCRTEACGNGTVECDEECDAGVDNGAAGSGCDAGCNLVTPAGCGNGDPDAGETCDDGASVACDGCSPICQLEACGNGVRECAEECDDGNTNACDGCAADCTLETCGDGVQQCDEECDLGEANGTPGGSCDVACRSGTICGLVTNQSPCIPCAADTDCDPAGRCGGGACTDGVCGLVPVPSCDDQSPGTIDRCVLDSDGTPSCEHECVGDQVCDDGDRCTVDMCAGVQGCTNAPLEGIDAIDCRIDTITGVLDDANPDDVRPALGRQLAKRLTKLERQIAAAERAAAQGAIKRERRVLRDIRNGLTKLGKVVAQARRKNKISQELADAIMQTAGAASQVADDLRNRLTT